MHYATQPAAQCCYPTLEDASGLTSGPLPMPAHDRSQRGVVKITSLRATRLGSAPKRPSSTSIRAPPMDESLNMILTALPYFGFGWLLARYPALRPPNRDDFLVALLVGRPFFLFGIGIAIFTAIIAG